MIEIHLSGVAKKYQREWVFRNLSKQISAGSKWSIKGGNGSGKTTLLNCIAGKNPFTEGEISYFYKGQTIPPDLIFKYLVISAPYLELPEEFSLNELLTFHFKFKNSHANMGFEEMADIMNLKPQWNKSISQFSSGMKQRLKLGLCFFSDVPLILLDEPTSNLDLNGVNWYLEMIEKYSNGRTIIVSSNEKREYGFCEDEILIEEFKKISS
jgi:ABC-type multidrug transport system ATPase subunit